MEILPPLNGITSQLMLVEQIPLTEMENQKNSYSDKLLAALISAD
jgi:hypothetical protein